MNFLLSRIHVRQFNRRAILLACLHAGIFAVVYFLAFLIRNDFSFDGWISTYLTTLGLLLAVKLPVFYLSGHCHSSWARVAFRDLTSLLWASTLAMLIFTFATTILTGPLLPSFARPPRSVILLDWAGTIFAIGGVRALYRSFAEEIRPLLSRTPIRTAIIVGANHAGELIARNLVSTSRSRYYVLGFLDNDPRLRHARVAGLEILGTVDDAAAVLERCNAEEVIVQSGMLTGKRFRDLLDAVTATGAQVKVLPAIDDLLDSGNELRHVQLRPVEINDLLRREPVELEDSAIRTLLADRTVMVTGAGGSIGSEICRQLIRFAPRRLLLVERAENALFLIEQEFSRLDPRPPFEPLLADVTDARRMEQIFEAYRPEVVFHAAAHKHVPMMEWNPAEAIKNNVFGTRQVAMLADRFGVQQFVAISTDKAVNPTSVMGSSKLLAERFVQAVSHESPTKFMVVRFGNVLASNGSVVPTFQEQIRRGGPITVTHPNIERFFMTIPEASRLVLQSAAQGNGGEIFVLDMGESVRIVDLARDLIALSGLNEDDIEITFTGLRPGEKLFEELYFADERRLATRHPKVFCAMHRPAELAAVEAVLEELTEVLDEPPQVVRDRLRDLVPEYAASTAGEPSRQPSDELRKTRAK
jgi:FlaA1/EpsC-like NDP-sugar epimerase